MRWAPALLKVSTVHLAPSSERPAATQSALPSTGATKPSSETDIFRTSEAMRCFLPGMDDTNCSGIQTADHRETHRPGAAPDPSRRRAVAQAQRGGPGPGAYRGCIPPSSDTTWLVM